ncbi:aarF domain-containing protein, chloroplastic [Raphidocelis subcapitata]|uniref:AarF domain-containing protein, chloroplastic n=1 Tax=Raphidocelis subcapitata TaxID=307507 RepID=A0A2V0NUC9_9CHLO|nr:aarF domain-containing protein, chloroplastic [Raphidocelis subcapitata]|eukprot:GBF89170.1 aarF domain-containing protein, chloroplastic [Raphidocelis subcapitata]
MLGRLPRAAGLGRSGAAAAAAAPRAAAARRRAGPRRRRGATTAVAVRAAAGVPSAGAAMVSLDEPDGRARAAAAADGGSGWFYSERGQQQWVEAMRLDTLSPDLPQLLIEMGIRYDPDKLAAVLASKWPQVYGRAVRIAASLGGFIAVAARDAALGASERNAPERADELRNLLSGLGPSFVKIGQALSARPDLLPQVYLESLADLQDRLPSFPNDIAFAVIEEELGRPLQEVYSEISEVPVAAASLGQVYRATLRATGERVAVKVQRPGIGESIATDMLLLRRLMGAVDDNLPQISQPLVPLVDEFAARLFGELDYVQEGRNAERFQELYGSMPRVRTPRIVWGATSRRVLTMEWIDGVKLTNREAMDAAGLSITDFVDVGIECTLRQLLEHGFFHADPHPGNLLASVDGTLVYLDFGMMSEAPQYARYAIISHVVHLVNRDYEAMCRDYYTLQFMDPSVDTAPIAPALQAFFDDVLEASVSELNFKAIVDGLGAVLFEYPFRVPAYYALILRSLTVLEGLALQADPKYKLLARAYPYMARRLLTDPAPELRGSFEELVIKDNRFRWNRLENLLREGSKSADFDPSQLWLLSRWLLGPNAPTVREKVAQELARMLDALAAGDARARLAPRLPGGAAAAEALVPTQPGEAEARRRAEALILSMGGRLQGGTFELPQGTGPLGLPSPGDVPRLVGSLQEGVSAAWPQLREALQQPGAQELAREISGSLARRFLARAIKFGFGIPEAQRAASAPAAGGAGAAAGAAAPAAGGARFV